MGFSDGDFLKIEFDAYRAADNTLVYTTDEKKAKESDIYDKNSKYGPQLAVLGKSSLIKGLDRALRTMNVNEAKKVEIEPDDAFGQRNPELMQVMSIADFRKRDINPYPGLQLDLDGTIATVKSVNSGRVLVDANHPLAGEKIVYNVKVIAKIEDENQKIKELSNYYDIAPDKVELTGTSVTVEYGSKVAKDANYFLNKSRFVGATFAYLDKISKVYVKEEYDRPVQK